MIQGNKLTLAICALGKGETVLWHMMHTVSINVAITAVSHAVPVRVQLISIGDIWTVITRIAVRV